MLENEKGQSLVEYIIIAVLLIIVIFASIKLFSGKEPSVSHQNSVQESITEQLNNK